MAKRKTWRSKLTKKEVEHMKWAGCHNLTLLKSNFESQARDRRRCPSIEPCWECRTIAEKLGFPV